MKSTIEITAVKPTFHSIIAASTDIDHFSFQLNYLGAEENISEAIWRTRCVTTNDDNYQDHRLQPFHPANWRNQIQLTYWVEHHSYDSIQCDHQLEKLPWTILVAGDKYDDNRIWPYQREKSNTIPTSQMHVVISRGTHNQWRGLVSALAMPRTKGEVARCWRVITLAILSLRIVWIGSSSIRCTPPTLATSKMLTGQQQQRQAADS